MYIFKIIRHLRLGGMYRDAHAFIFGEQVRHVILNGVTKPSTSAKHLFIEQSLSFQTESFCQRMLPKTQHKTLGRFCVGQPKILVD